MTGDQGQAASEDAVHPRSRRVVKLEDLKAEAESRGGMSWDRYNEIAKARSAGEDIQTTPEEDAEFEQAAESFQETLSGITKGFAPKLSAIRDTIFAAQRNPWLSDKTDDHGPSVQESLGLQVFSEMQRTRDQQVRVVQQQRELQAGIAEAVAAKEEKEENQRQVARDQLDAMQAMVTQMEQQAAEARKVAKQQSRTNRRILIVAVLTLLATIGGVVVAVVALAAQK